MKSSQGRLQVERVSVVGCVFLTWDTLVLVIQPFQESRLPATARHWTLFT